MTINTAQFMASDPKVSAWITASAGTGKTKVLTDRILNLLLDGFAPEKILCLTFTKAAAAEMANRLTNRLAQWATLSDGDLSREVTSLRGAAPLPSLLTRARHLFPLVLDTAGSMKIQTIHGFCQSLLSRFPLEAGIAPHFQVLDDVGAEEMLLEAQHAVFTNPSPEIESALAILNPFMGDNRFSAILKDFYAYRDRVTSLLNQRADIWDYAADLIEFFAVSSLTGKPQDLLNPDLLSHLKAQIVPPGIDFETYSLAYLTQKGEIRKRLPPERLIQATRIFHLNQSFSALETAQRTLAFLILFNAILADYQDRKSRHCTLDYDDLIQQTLKLLNTPSVASWVLYKLDGGIDHLLIDEAQDTNTAQWQIILTLASEFFDPAKPYRTIFAVGDAKQSIYSFQGANPEDFLRLKAHFAALTENIGQGWHETRLDLSYRSTTAILAIVDQVFANDKTREGVAFDHVDIAHHAFREDHPGLVALWPLMMPEAEGTPRDGKQWVLPLERVDRLSPRSRLASYLADQVASWVTSGERLPSTHQPIQPRDILILVRKRTELVPDIIRALKKRNIPVAGADRLVLTDHIAAMDLRALGEFVLLPDDDLTLACLLRSPLIGLSEEDLFALAYQREGTLWASLTQKAYENGAFEKACVWLKACLDKADLCPVYEFYHWVLTEQEGRKRFLSRLGYEADDALEEFLSQALLYDQDHVGSLQGFIHYISSQNQEIKRDACPSNHNQVRIMTVHGAKGLQAPIVILPDASESGKGKSDTLLWGENLVMLRPSQANDTERTRTLKEEREQETAREQSRLLYVALTRAQDRLYVGGWGNHEKDIAEDCWYRLIQDAVESKAGVGAMSYQEGRPSFQQIIYEDAAPVSPPLPPWIFEKPVNGILRKKKTEKHLFNFHPFSSS